jgi:hypothetical protein
MMVATAAHPLQVVAGKVIAIMATVMMAIVIVKIQVPAKI